MMIFMDVCLRAVRGKHNGFEMFLRKPKITAHITFPCINVLLLLSLL